MNISYVFWLLVFRNLAREGLGLNTELTELEMLFYYSKFILK